MKSLKALLLENCYKLESVPYLGKLIALRELNLSATAIKEVPQGVEELLNLKFLSMNAHLLKMLPRGLLLKLGHLQHVSFPLFIQVPVEELENLKQLEEFTGGVKNVTDFNCFIQSRVHDACYSIGVGLHDTTHYLIGEERFGYSYNNELILCECNLKNEEVLGQGVVCLTIMKCEGLSMCFVDDLSRLNNPTSLKRLRIRNCGGIECILRSEQGLPSQISNTLECIYLEDLEDLKGVIEKGEIGEIGCASAAPAQPLFYSLRRITIENCDKMKKLGLLAVPNLESITILRCEEMEEIFEDEGRDSITLTKLKWLILGGLPRLKRVCKSAMICNSILQIDILKCPILMKKLPLHADDPPPPALRVIMVEREWWESLEWDNPDLPQLLQDFVYFGE